MGFWDTLNSPNPGNSLIPIKKKKKGFGVGILGNSQIFGRFWGWNSGEFPDFFGHFWGWNFEQFPDFLEAFHRTTAE